jgi:hypothetical protein
MGLKIDVDIFEFADTLATKALKFIRETDGDPCLESVSQWGSFVQALAEPIQRLRNHAKEKAEYNRKMRDKPEEIPCVNPMCPCTKVPNS